MQIVSLGDNLHEMSVFFLEKIRKEIKLLFAEIFTQHDKQ